MFFFSKYISSTVTILFLVLLSLFWNVFLYLLWTDQTSLKNETFYSFPLYGSEVQSMSPYPGERIWGVIPSKFLGMFVYFLKSFYIKCYAYIFDDTLIINTVKSFMSYYPLFEVIFGMFSWDFYFTIFRDVFNTFSRNFIHIFLPPFSQALNKNFAAFCVFLGFFIFVANFGYVLNVLENIQCFIMILRIKHPVLIWLTLKKQTCGIFQDFCPFYSIFLKHWVPLNISKCTIEYYYQVLYNFFLFWTIKQKQI